MQRVIKAKHQCETIMDALPELIALLDVHGNVIRVNLTLETWRLGKVDTIQGVKIHDMLHPDCSDWGCRLRTLCELMWQQLDGFNPMHYEIRDHRLNRDLRFSICRYSRPRHVNDTDKEGYASLIIEDISQQKHTEQVLNNYNEELEKRLQERTLDLTRTNALLKGKIDDHIRDAAALRESEKKYTCLVETTLTGLYVIQDKKLVFCNGRFAEIFDYPHEDIYRLELTQLFPDDDPEAITAATDSPGTESTFDKQIVRGATRRGDTLWLQRSLTRVDCMGDPMILGNVIDITEQKMVEEALRLPARTQDAF
jgi:PAS domain S-box-containing protein